MRRNGDEGVDGRQPAAAVVDGGGGAGMVTIKFGCESPTFNERLESSLVRFLAHDFLDGPRQRRAF